MAGPAPAVISIDMNPGHVVLCSVCARSIGAQTHATFPMLFNALYLLGVWTGTTPLKSSKRAVSAKRREPMKP